ncbi:hypothetical protein, partial [Aeromonas caviae]|uniref:hypothetical protein n=1 Tax=Aeromonas caviae TaxID=648 RepID=UPI002B45A6A8
WIPCLLSRGMAMAQRRCSTIGISYLDASAYEHQPQFQQFATQNQLPFKAAEVFDKTQQQTRRELVVGLVELIWSPERLNEAAYS